MNKTILVSAYGCEPDKGSEPGVGWGWILQIGRKNRLHVVTRSNNRESIENCLPKELSHNITFHYYDCPLWIRKLKRKENGLYLYYFIWQLGAIKVYENLAKQYKFDYTWHLSFGSWWMPTFLPLLKNPFIYGPIGGADPVPWHFLPLLRWKDCLQQAFRYVLMWTACINPLIMFPCCRARSILCRTSNNQMMLPGFLRKKSKVILETSMNLSELNPPKIKAQEEMVQMMTTGRLISFKNIETIIKALAIVKKSHDFRFTSIGEGPQLPHLLSMVKEYGLEKYVTFKKQMPRTRVIKELERGDIYLCASLREGGSWALMEAMAMKLVPICLNWTGMGVITDDDSAIRLEVSSPSQMVRDMADAIIKLIENHEMRFKMGIKARKRIEEGFNWDAKGEFVENLFAELDSK